MVFVDTYRLLLGLNLVLEVNWTGICGFCVIGIKFRILLGLELFLGGPKVNL